MSNNYVLLERIELNNTAASVTFDNIPQSGYTDLKVVVSARGTTNGGALFARFNGTSTGYSTRQLFGSGSSVGSGAGGGGSSFADCGIMGQSSNTANTFSNQEIYIPNYRSSSFKSISVDSVNENNATEAYAILNAVLWSNTAAINSITFTPQNGPSFEPNSTFSLYGIAAVGVTPTVAPKADGGNVIGTDGTYWYHAFLSNGTFTPQVGLTADVLVVAGGGGGGFGRGGGGGAGGLLHFPAQSLVVANYNIPIGSGGVGGLSGVNATNGNDSQFGSLTLVKGGGFGGVASNDGVAGGAGGSAGGSGMNTISATIITNPSVSGQGFAGGSGGGTSSNYAGGGGGGAGAVGGNANPSTGGAGLSTFSAYGSATSTGQNISGTFWYAGGGGGGREYNTSVGGNGGGGGSGSGGGINGTVNAGAGGGGGAFYGFPQQPAGNGGAGGSGIVIIRYLVA